MLLLGRPRLPVRWGDPRGRIQPMLARGEALRGACYHSRARGPSENSAFTHSIRHLIKSLRLYAIVLVAAAFLIPLCRAAEDTVTLNFVNADIDAVVKAVAEMTGRNFVLDPKVKGVVNIVSARPVPKSLVYPTLLSAL